MWKPYKCSCICKNIYKWWRLNACDLELLWKILQPNPNFNCNSKTFFDFQELITLLISEEVKIVSTSLSGWSKENAFYSNINKGRGRSDRISFKVNMKTCMVNISTWRSISWKWIWAWGAMFNIQVQLVKFSLIIKVEK